eukprot:499782_1
MTELDTLQKFAAWMPDIKTDASECYKILNNQVLAVLNAIKSKYDLLKCSTESSKNLRDALKKYFDVKNDVDINILNNNIMKCRLPTLTDLINANNNKINAFKNKNKSIDRIMEEKSGSLIGDIKKYAKWTKHGKNIKMDEDLDEDDLKTWLTKVGHTSLKEIKSKLKNLNEESKKICNKEKEQKENNINKINELNKINDEVQKCVQTENVIKKLLKPRDVIEYRTDNNCLQKKINKLNKLLARDSTFMFEKLALSDAYNSLQFLTKCKAIKWSLGGKINVAIEEKHDEIAIDELSVNVLSNTYVNEINKNVLEYLRKYGDNLESNLNDLIGNLKVKDDVE